MHPSLFPFLSPERWLSFLSHCLSYSPDEIESARSLLAKNVLPVVKGPELGHFLGVSPKIIALMATKTPRFYNTFRIPKKSGGTRTISAPRVYLKQTQRYILDCILNSIDLPSAVVGFRKNISLLDGAQPHLKNRFLWNIDIKNFFPTISKSMVTEEFRKIGYSNHAASFLASICTLGEQLPQGAPTSPALANIVFSRTDLLLIDLCNSNGITYTRYADDLSFSSAIELPHDFRRDVKSLISGAGFKLNTKKERLIGPMGRREVTGVVINERLSIPRKKRRNIRAAFHQVSLSEIISEEQISQLAGFIGWLEPFHPDEAQIYREILDSKKKPVV